MLNQQNDSNLRSDSKIDSINNVENLKNNNQKNEFQSNFFINALNCKKQTLKRSASLPIFSSNTLLNSNKLSKQFLKKFIKVINFNIKIIYKKFFNLINNFILLIT